MYLIVLLQLCLPDIHGYYALFYFQIHNINFKYIKIYNIFLNIRVLMY